jgi:hypothetical protein
MLGHCAACTSITQVSLYHDPESRLEADPEIFPSLRLLELSARDVVHQFLRHEVLQKVTVMMTL